MQFICSPSVLVDGTTKLPLEVHFSRCYLYIDTRIVHLGPVLAALLLNYFGHVISGEN